HLEPADRLTVAGGRDQPPGDRVAGERRRRDRLGAERAEPGLLLPGGRGVDARVGGVAETLDQLRVQVARAASGDRDDLRREQGEDDAVLVGGPHGAVAAEEGGARGLLPAEPDGG